MVGVAVTPVPAPPVGPECSPSARIEQSQEVMEVNRPLNELRLVLEEAELAPMAGAPSTDAPEGTLGYGA